MSLIDRIKQWEDDKFSYHKKFINNPYLIAKLVSIMNQIYKLPKIFA